jgi:prepilin-type N-terminal cleavage/methylation domain-containing protein
MRPLYTNLKSLISGSSRGFTLAEVVVSVGILGVMLSLIGGALFQALDVTRWWKDDVLSARDFRHAISSFSRDAPNAETTNLNDGGPASATVTMAWYDSNATLHTASYSLASGQLVRDYDGVQTIVARDLSSVGFSHLGQVLKVSLTATDSEGVDHTKALDIYARRLQ